MRWWKRGTVFMVSERPRKLLKLFLLFHHHRKQHHVEWCIAREIGTGCRVPARGGKEFIQHLLIFRSQGASIPPPARDLLMDKLCKGGEGSAH